MLLMFLPCIGQQIAFVPKSMMYLTWSRDCEKAMAGSACIRVGGNSSTSQECVNIIDMLVS